MNGLFLYGPHSMKRLYFDYNATAPIASGLSERLGEWLNLKNPSSVHQDGQAARAAIESARKTHLELLGAGKGDRLIFTSGGTEANNTVIRSAYLGRGEKKRMLLTNVEHSSVYNCAQALEKSGVELDFIRVSRDGTIDIDEYQKKLGDDVFLVSVMLSNNETGFLFPIAELSKRAHAKNILFHTDAVCGAGKWPIHFANLGVDFLSFSSHKFGGLKGIGGLLVRQSARMTPLILGGTHEQEKRAGTENVPGILSSAYALEKSLQDLDAKLVNMKTQRERLKSGMKKIYPNLVFIESNDNLPQTLSAAFVGLNGNLLLTNLDLEGVSASYGSACASGSLEVSRVMKNLSLPLECASSALRFSFGAALNESEVKDFLGRLEKVVSRMEAVSAA